MAQDFQRFCRECFRLELQETASGEDPPLHLDWNLLEETSDSFDRQDKAVEAFEIHVDDGKIRIEGRHERGLLQGTHYLEWMMANRGGPFLPLQSLRRSPCFMPRISNGVFIPGHQTLAAPGVFSDDYLSLMSHYGVNGIHVYLDLWSVFSSTILSELNSPDFDAQIAALRSLNARTLQFGIDVYLHLNTPPLSESHPVFSAHPEARGARVEIFTEELSGKPWHNLCSGNEKVLAAYGEVIGNLLRAAPDVAGAIMIIGGECFYHCFTRPADAENGDTNCPHCRGKDASAEVANLVNTVKRAVKNTGLHKALYAWPYSAFIWSSKDPAQLRWIKHLDADVSVLTNFDCGDEDLSCGAGVRFFDYNIKCIGPSDVFARQKALLESKRRAIFTKVETCTTPDAFFLPYLPVHYRWFARSVAMKRTNVHGFIVQWRFFGMNGSPPEELQYRVNWEENPDADEFLRTICFRDFHLTVKETEQVLKGWRLLSDAWEDFPYSAMTGGERNGYMRGPFYLGPAHPMIFDVQDRYNLPSSFFSLRGDLEELLSPEEMEKIKNQVKARYVSDLLITLPFGVERYLELLAICRSKWKEGRTLLKNALESGADRARMELDVCRTIDSHLRALENVVRFYQARDHLQNVACTCAEFSERMAVLENILDDEISNAESMLPVLERDRRIGYGHCYGPVYDAEMVKSKIAQCLHVRDIELPRFSKIIRFHVWTQSP